MGLDVFGIDILLGILGIILITIESCKYACSPFLHASIRQNRGGGAYLRNRDISM